MSRQITNVCSKLASSGKNTHEFFAEAFATFCSDKKLPKQIAALMKECI
jgi:hypothetical protein